MLKITYRNLTSTQFNSALSKIAKYDGLPDLKAIYNVAKIAELCDREQKIASTIYQNLMMKQSIKMKGVQQDANQEENSESKESNQKSNQESIEQETRKLVDEFFNTEFVIEKRHKIGFEDIKHVKLSPVELLAIYEIVEIPQDMLEETIGELESSKTTT